MFAEYNSTIAKFISFLLGDDGHQSQFSVKWLCHNLFESRKPTNFFLWDKKKIFNSIEEIKVPLEDYKNTTGATKLLSNIISHGFGMVTGVSLISNLFWNPILLKFR